MRNLRVTAMVAGALVSGLVLGGIGIGVAVAATSAAGSPTAVHSRLGALDTTEVVTPPSDGTTVTPPSDGTTVTPPSDGTTVTPPSDGTTPSVPATCTPRPPMPPQARGHAYGRMIPHPHQGLHRGMRGHSATAPGQVAKHAPAGSPRGPGTAHGNSGHMGGSPGNSGHANGSMMGH